MTGVSGSVLLDIGAWRPATRHGQFENPHPVKNCLVRLLDANDATDVAWTKTDYQGRFEFDSSAVGDRDPASLALEVLAHRAGALAVCHGSETTPWSFFVASRDLPHGAPGVVASPGPGMRIDVPALERPVRVAHPDGLTAGTERHRSRRAFWVYCFLNEMRRWYWSNGARDGTYNREDADLTVIYPAKGSWYSPTRHDIYLDGYNDAADALPELAGGRYDFSNSWLAHEFGHHLFCAAAPRCPKPVGSHAFRHRERPRFEDQQSLRHQLALDFSEGYATFVAQAFLNDPRYTAGNDTADDLETPNCSSGFGDGATAGYLWDLFDPDSPAEVESIDLTFAQIHTTLQRFAEARGDRYLTLPDFHDYISDGPGRDLLEGEDRDHLALILRQNDLLEPYELYRQLPQELRDEVVRADVVKPPGS